MKPVVTEFKLILNVVFRLFLNAFKTTEMVYLCMFFMNYVDCGAPWLWGNWPTCPVVIAAPGA